MVQACLVCALRRQAVRMRSWAMQQGDDTVPNDHVTKAGKLRDKSQLNSPPCVCLAARKARMGSMKEGYTHQGEKSKSLTFTKVRNPLLATHGFIQTVTFAGRLRRKFNSKVE